jgi:hypothetical protein
LSPSYSAWLEHPPSEDQIIRTVARKMAGGQPLIQGDLVVAGRETRSRWPLANRFPVHFRKSYYPTCFHQDPAIEFRHHTRAAEILGLPQPIGAARTTFRSCFIPGRPWTALSPFGVEPLESNIAIARSTKKLVLAALWKLLGEIHQQVIALHENGLAHGDLFLHNVIVTNAPLRVYLIDFELAVDRGDEETSEEKWRNACSADLTEILKEAICIQCGLGPQDDALATEAKRALPDLTGRSAGRFRRALKHSGSPWS